MCEGRDIRMQQKKKHERSGEEDGEEDLQFRFSLEREKKDLP